MKKRSTDLALPTLTPQEYELVRLYMDPLLPTFGSRMGSAKAAGYAPDYASRLFEREAIAAEINRIALERRDAGTRVAEFLGDYAWDAARELVTQLSFGKELTIIDPREVLSVNVLESFELVPDEMDERKPPVLKLRQGVPVPHLEVMEQIKQINLHNRTAVAAVKERRAAAELIIAYKIGTPEQRVQHTHKNELADGDLGKLTKEQLEVIGAAVSEELNTRRGPTKVEAVVVDGDYEVEDP